ncbi:hypothetical protein JVT61DRAFT_12051 [Boletus reticuloceps]|uniref:Uncharacterized protein n=1 Tax=Boletus reticuloceps TaxID=495285 RepID=A0A8I2YEE3_9AGAM|nr:hypothetical protein JVT61DRAFT_12051 [Boletus reticuloceps]
MPTREEMEGIHLKLQKEALVNKYFQRLVTATYPLVVSLPTHPDEHLCLHSTFCYET